MKPFQWLARRTCFTFATAFLSVLGGQVASLYGYFYFHGHFLVEGDLDTLRGLGASLWEGLIFFLLVVSLIHYLSFGLLRAFGLPWEWKKLRIVNESLRGLEVERSLSPERALELLRALCRFPVWNTAIAAALGFCLFAGLMGILFFHTKNVEHLSVGIEAGVIALIIYLSITYLITEFLSAPARSQTKKLIHELGGRFEEAHQLSLKVKFAFFVVLLLFSLFVMNSLGGRPQGERGSEFFVGLFALVSVGLCSFVVVLYFTSIFRSIQEARAAAQELASGETGYLFSGSLDKEFVLLNRSILAAADEVNRHRMHLEELVRQKTLELERSLSELDEREKRFRALVEGGSDIISILAADGTYLYQSPSSERILGYETSEIIGMNAFHLIHKDDRKAALDLFVRIMESPAVPATVEYRFPHKDGSWRILESKGKNLLDDPAVRGVVVNSRDVTDRCRTEEALKENEEKFRTISDSAQDAIVMMDSEGDISFWNRSAEKIFGYSREEAAGKNLHQLLVPERFHAAYTEGFGKFQKTGQGAAIGKTLELVALNQGGEEIPIELSLSAVKLKGAWHAVGLARDITDRKQAELALQQAKEAAEAATRTKSQFLANMSHEIRTPMNGVIGMTGLLLETELSAEQREYAETISTSADSLLGLINDILDFSKIEAGRLELEVMDFDLRAAVEETLDVVVIKTREKGLELHCLLQPTVPTALRGDPGRLRQVLLNLVGNAIKFTEKGDVFLHVTREEETENRITLRFSVTDTGIGIPKDRMDRLFQSFSQVDASTTRKYGGTGLGLAISAKLAERMGGRIGVESRQGRGSTFWFTAVLDKQPEAGRQEEAFPEDIQGLRVLVVDDNATNRLVLREQLRSWGCVAIECERAPHALVALRQARAQGSPFRVALLDMQMPEMDGEDLALRIKADPELCDTVLVLLSSMGRYRDSAQLQEIGFSAYLSKPVKKSHLYNCLVSVLGAGLEATGGRSVPASALSDTPKPAKRGRARILVAEDNPVNQKVALRMLEKLGYSADTVSNGKEAVRALEMISYGLVLMDVQMPEMNGLEAAAVIRDPNSRVRNHAVPVVAMTAHAMTGDREMCLQAGMDDYIPKPVNPGALQKVLGKYLASAEPSETRPPTGADAGQASVQIRQIQETADGDKAFERELIELFLSDNEERLRTLEFSLKASDAETARREAHTIKGASASAGARGMQEIACKLERVDTRRELLQALEILEELKTEFEQVRSYFVNYLNLPEFLPTRQ